MAHGALSQELPEAKSSGGGHCEVRRRSESLVVVDTFAVPVACKIESLLDYLQELAFLFYSNSRIKVMSVTSLSLQCFTPSHYWLNNLPICMAKYASCSRRKITILIPTGRITAMDSSHFRNKVSVLFMVYLQIVVIPSTCIMEHHVIHYVALIVLKLIKEAHRLQQMLFPSLTTNPEHLKEWVFLVVFNQPIELIHAFACEVQT